MLIALDMETTLATNAEPVPRLVSIAVATPVAVDLYTPDRAPRLETAWRGHDLLFANAPFDVFVMLRAWPDLLPAVVAAYEEGRVHDVLTREKLIDIAAGEHFQRGRYDLGSVARRRAGIQLTKDDVWRTNYVALSGVPLEAWPPAARRYAIDDAAATLATYLAQEPCAHLFRPAADLARKHLALYAQTLRGLLTDPDAVRQLDARIREELRASIDELVRAGLGRWKRTQFTCDLGAASAAMVRWCEAHGLAIPETPKGLRWVVKAGKQRPAWAWPHPEAEDQWFVPKGVQISEDSIREAGVPDDHPLGAYRRFKALRAQWAKNLPVLTAPRVRTRYDECKDTMRAGSSAPQGDTPAHRLRASEWVGTNLQNLPQVGGYRECLVPDPGERFVISDWGGAELVTNAQNQIDVLGNSRLAEALQAGRNPHDETAAAFLEIDLARFDRGNPQHERVRRFAKEWNFGKWGGGGDLKFQTLLARKGIQMPLDQIKRFTAIWREVWHARRYFEWVQTQPQIVKQLADGRVIPLYVMTHHRTGFTKGGCTYTEACNFPFQHLAAAAAGTALWDLWREGLDKNSPLFRRNHWTAQSLFVHDENVSSVPTHLVEAAGRRQDEIMIDAFRHWCPDVPITVDTKIKERYGK